MTSCGVFIRKNTGDGGSGMNKTEPRRVGRDVKEAVIQLHRALDLLGPKDVLHLKVLQIDCMPVLTALRTYETC
jgi:hypothetical protein